MAGFAVNIQKLFTFPNARFTCGGAGYLETNFLSQLATLHELEPKVDNFTKVMREKGGLSAVMCKCISLPVS